MVIPVKNMHKESKVWIFQAGAEFTKFQTLEIKTEVLDFVRNWTAHARQLVGSGDVIFHRFIVLMIDETFGGASGCSIDTSMHFIEKLEMKYGIDLLDRQKVAYVKDPNTMQIAITKLEELPTLYATNQINSETLVFNNLVKTKEEMDSKWITPIKESWHVRFLKK